MNHRRVSFRSENTLGKVSATCADTYVVTTIFEESLGVLNTKVDCLKLGEGEAV
jgi:hypothetical protein